MHKQKNRRETEGVERDLHVTLTEVPATLGMWSKCSHQHVGRDICHQLHIGASWSLSPALLREVPVIWTSLYSGLHCALQEVYFPWISPTNCQMYPPIIVTTRNTLWHFYVPPNEVSVPLVENQWSSTSLIYRWSKWKLEKKDIEKVWATPTQRIPSTLLQTKEHMEFFSKLFIILLAMKGFWPPCALSHLDRVSEKSLWSSCLNLQTSPFITNTQYSPCYFSGLFFTYYWLPLNRPYNVLICGGSVRWLAL